MFVNLTLEVDLDDPIVKQAKDDPKNWYMSQGHIGTHLDVCPGQEPPPVEFCSRRGVLIDVRETGYKEIGVNVIESCDIVEGDFVVFYTGHLKVHEYGSPDYFNQQPRMTWELVDRLANSPVSLFGLDFPGMRARAEHGRAAMMCARGGKYVIENLDNVDRLHSLTGARPFRIFTGWTGFKGATGLSCRVTALVD